MSETQTPADGSPLTATAGISIHRIAEQPTSDADALYRAIEYAQAEGTAEELAPNDPIAGYVATDPDTGYVGYGDNLAAALYDLASRLSQALGDS